MAGMSFYTERFIQTAKKDHVCDCCGGTIPAGTSYYRESGKYDGEMFDRCLHDVCHFMEAEYCSEVDCEFTWDAISDYISEQYCYDCPRSAINDDAEHFDECDTDIYHCPIIREKIMPGGTV